MESFENYQIKKNNLVKEFLEKKSKGEIGINKKTSNLFRGRVKTKKQKLNISSFDHVISIDEKNMTADVEGMTPFEDLVKVTIEHNLLPPVVPQLKTITLGGAISGIGIESSSFKYGLVHETVLEMDILLGDGKVITCTPINQYKDLFFTIPNSYGSLGYILRAKIKLIKAKNFVKINHIRFTDSKKYFTEFNEYCSDKNYDYIDGTIFSENEMYITLATFVNSAPKKSNYKYMKIYYRSIQKNQEDYLKTIDYIWRWDADWFWCSKVFYMQNFGVRLLLGKFMLNSRSYIKVKKFYEKLNNNLLNKFNGKNKKEKKESVIQDVGIPIENCTRFLDFFQKNIKIKPIWACPTRSYKKNIYPLFNLKPEKLYIDFGFWDFIETNKEFGYYNRLLEKKVEELSGKKSLYSLSFYPEKEFWEIFDGKSYFKVKNKYDKDKVFLNLYEKCVKRK